MSRARVDLPDGRFVIYGFDRPMNTMFAQLYNPGDNPNDAPVKAVGYHPMERLAGERTEHDVYPADLGDIDRVLTAWNVPAAVCRRVGEILFHDRGATMPGSHRRK